MDKEEELKLKELISIGEDANRWLEHPCYKRAILTIRAELMSSFEETRSKESAERDEIWRKLQALNWVVQCIEKTARDGSSAKKSLLNRIKNKFI